MNQVLVFSIPIGLLGLSALAAYFSVRLDRRSGPRANRRKEQSLIEHLPYWSLFEDDGTAVMVHVDLRHSSYLELIGIDSDCLDDGSLNQIGGALATAIENLPSDTMLQFQHWTSDDVGASFAAHRQAVFSGPDLGKQLVDNKLDFLKRLRHRRDHLLLSITVSPQAKRKGLRGRMSLRNVENALRKDLPTRLARVREDVARALEAAQFRVRPLSIREMQSLIYPLLNGTLSPAGTDSVQPSLIGRCHPDRTVREELALTGMRESERDLVIGNERVRVLTLRTMPTETKPFMIEKLLFGLDFPIRVQMSVEPVDATRALDALKRRRDQAHLLATLRERRNQEAEAQEDEVSELIDAQLRCGQRLVQLSLSVVLRVDARLGNASDLLDQQTAEVIRVGSDLYGARVVVDELCQFDEYLATLPGNGHHGRRFRQCTSDNAAYLLPVSQAWTGSERRSLLVENGRGNLVGVDPFDSALDNPNACMAGASGSGKSSTTNFLLVNALAAGVKVLIVDEGGSYRRVIDIFGGQYFSLSLDPGQDCALNPFFPAPTIVGTDSKLEERRLQFLLAVLERMACEGAATLSNPERAVLVRCLEETYRRLQGRTPILSDLLDVLATFRLGDPEDELAARQMARQLRVWAEGPAGRLINRQSTISLTADCAAFDLKGLESHPQLQAVVLLTLSGIMWNLVLRDPTEKKIIVFDEVWRLLESPSSARLIGELYRTSRKYSCSILTISQSVEDFTASPIAAALINNSATTYLLKHRRGHDLVADQFKLNDRERTAFEKLEMRRGEYTEALVLFGERHFVARIRLSPLEYWIATTHPADLALERELRGQHPQASRLEIARMLAATHPKGAQAPNAARKAA